MDTGGEYGTGYERKGGDGAEGQRGRGAGLGSGVHDFNGEDAHGAASDLSRHRAELSVVQLGIGGGGDWAVSGEVTPRRRKQTPLHVACEIVRIRISRRVERSDGGDAEETGEGRWVALMRANEGARPEAAGGRIVGKTHVEALETSDHNAKDRGTEADGRNGA